MAKTNTQPQTPPTSNVRELPKRPPQLLESSLVPAEFQRQRFSVTPPAGTSPGDLLVPSYWVHVARLINPGAILEVVPKDATFFQELFVVRTEKHAVHCIEMRLVDLLQLGDLSDLEAFEIGYVGDSGKWRAVRKSDNQPVISGLTSKAAVVAHLRSQAA